MDVVSDGENIKKILKIPYSNAPVSMVVHRVGKTLLIDDFDISKFILRRSATEWEWIRKFFHEIVLQQIDKVRLIVDLLLILQNSDNSVTSDRKCCCPQRWFQLGPSRKKPCV